MPVPSDFVGCIACPRNNRACKRSMGSPSAWQDRHKIMPKWPTRRPFESNAADLPLAADRLASYRQNRARCIDTATKRRRFRACCEINPSWGASSESPISAHIRSARTRRAPATAAGMDNERRGANRGSGLAARRFAVWRPEISGRLCAFRLCQRQGAERRLGAADRARHVRQFQSRRRHGQRRSRPGHRPPLRYAIGAGARRSLGRIRPACRSVELSERFFFRFLSAAAGSEMA